MTHKEMMGLYVMAMKRVSELGSSGAPVNLHQLAQRLGVAEIEPRVMKLEGYLAKRDDGRLAIRFRSDASVARQRFTIAHEIGHILIAEAQGREIDKIQARGSDRRDSEEYLANRIAAGILMPEDQVNSGLGKYGVSWEALYAISTRLNVSLSALIWRLRETRGLFAVEMRIVHQHSKACKNQFELWTTRGCQVRFHAPPASLCRQISVAQENGPYPIPIDINGVERVVKCIRRTIDTPVDSCFQLVGWLSQEPSK